MEKDKKTDKKMNEIDGKMVEKNEKEDKWRESRRMEGWKKRRINRRMMVTLMRLLPTWAPFMAWMAALQEAVLS